MTKEDIRRMIHRIDEASDQAGSQELFEALIDLREELLGGIEEWTRDLLDSRAQTLIDGLCEAAIRQDGTAFAAHFSDLAAELELGCIREPVASGAEELRRQCERQAAGIRLTQRLRRIQRRMNQNRPSEEKREAETRGQAEERIAVGRMDRLIWLYRFKCRAEIRVRNLERQRSMDQIRKKMEIGPQMEKKDEVLARESWMKERMENVEDYLDSRRIFFEETGLSDCRERSDSIEQGDHEWAEQETSKERAGAGNPAANCLPWECETD